MGIAGTPASAKLFLAIMYVSDSAMHAALRRFSEKFGAAEAEFGPRDVAAYTGYYDDEMGAGIQKKYLVYERLIARDALSGIKNYTNTIEASMLIQDKRTVNLDPGYLTNDKLVLASTKDFYHRLYLAHGIFGEVTLHFKKGRYRFFSWTYPDYQDRELLAFFMKVRAQLVNETRAHAASPQRTGR